LYRCTIPENAAPSPNASFYIPVGYLGLLLWSTTVVMCDTAGYYALLCTELAVS